MAPSTRVMRKSVLDRDILPIFKERLLSEVQAEDCRYRATRYAAVKKSGFMRVDGEVYVVWLEGIRLFQLFIVVLWF
ncbi:hypothetical protein LMG26846_04959 [Achromobacter insuavis]|nr:hypothetical protein LMG26846_04959 [Achromobacter insuavis]